MDTDRTKKVEAHQIRTPEGKRLDELQRRVGQWRRMRQQGTRVPEELWVDAIWLAKRLGVYRTAHAVGLPYESLKRRVGEEKSARVGMTKATRRHAMMSQIAAVTAGKRDSAHKDERVGFVEFGHIGAASPEIATTTTVVEVADGSGRRLTVQLGAGMAVDLAGILAAFGRRSA